MIQQSHFWVYIQRKWKQDLEEVSALSYWLLFTHNSQAMETTQVSINRWMDKEDVVYIHNEILFIHEKEGNLAIYDNIKGT